MDLQTLIARRRGGRSLQDLADETGMAKQTWATHANPPEGGGRRMPEAETILGIARGLDVDPEAVILAIGETMGVIPGERSRPPLLMQLPPADVVARLSPEDVDTVVRLVSLLADRQSAGRRGRGTRAPAAASGASGATPLAARVRAPRTAAKRAGEVAAVPAVVVAAVAAG